MATGTMRAGHLSFDMSELPDPTVSSPALSL